MKATRLPNKPLATIAGEPMIVHVWRRAVESGLGDVIVACDGHEIARAIERVGGKAIITNPDHPSGSDRIWEAVERSVVEGDAPLRGGAADPSGSGWNPTQGSLHDIIINLQGDVPTLEPRLLSELIEPLANPAVDIATLAAEITRSEEHDNPNIVKIILSEGGLTPPSREALTPAASGSGWNPTQESKTKGKIGRALYFTRATAPYGEGPRYHHIGVYAYRRAALKQFVGMKPSPLETREKLEQLRALEAGMRIDVRVVDTVPLGVDTEEDLARARKLLGSA